MRAGLAIIAAAVLLTTSALAADEEQTRFPPTNNQMTSFADFGFNGLGIDTGSYYGYKSDGSKCEVEQCLPNVTITGNRISLHATGGSFGSAGRYLVDRNSVGYGIFYEPPEDLTVPVVDPAKCKADCTTKRGHDKDLCDMTVAQLSATTDITSIGAGVAMTIVGSRLLGTNFGARAGLATYGTTLTTTKALVTQYASLCSANAIKRSQTCEGRCG